MEVELLDLCARLRRRQLRENIACRLFAALLPRLVSALRGAGAPEPTVGAVAASVRSASALVNGAAQSMYSLAHVSPGARVCARAESSDQITL
jgi:hypothetical protein